MHGGVESDRNVRAGYVVVDRLRDADDGKPVLREEAMSDPQRSSPPIATTPSSFEQARRLDSELHAVFLTEAVVAGRAV